VRQRQLNFDSLAITDTGEKAVEILTVSNKLWQRVADIPGFKPHPRDEKSCLAVLFVVIIIFVVAVIIGLMKLSDILHRIQ
jgi:hypothetical protein